jgi:SnoaL-like protein
MTDINALIDGYIATWNETDPDRRRDLVARTFTEDSSYLDPLMAGAGQDQIDAMIGAAQQQFPGMRFELAAAPDHYNDRVRFSWHLRPAAGGDTVAVGHDFAILAEDGRLASVTGFLET